MSARLLARLGGLSIAILLVLSAAQAAQADTLVGGTNVWLMVGAPLMQTQLGKPVGETMFSNNISVTVTGIVLMVIRNSANQTVYYSTGTSTLGSGQIGPVYVVTAGLANGNYTATFFAFTFSGVAISLPTTLQFTIPLA